MATDLTDQEKTLIREKIREKYGQAAVSPAGCFSYPTGVQGLRQLGYPEEWWRDLPAALLESFLGVGNPFSLGRLLPQMAFHAHAAWTHGGPLNLVVPTGNLGDAVAAVWAREVGVPVGEIVLSTNANRVLADHPWKKNTANPFDAGGAGRPRNSR